MKYRCIPIKGNSQKLDGGAMFGNVPKPLWSKWVTPDENNRIDLACRALLIQDGTKNILLEAGIGAFFAPHLRERFGVQESEHVLLNSLQEVGLTHDEIDIVILSHLHFDHAGGLLSAWEEDRPATLLFPNAHFYVSKTGWERACHPHFRDRASFIPELNQLLEQSGRLHIIDQQSDASIGSDFQFMFTDGHTPGLLHTYCQIDDQKILFASDLIPGTPWVHLPVSMGYDRAPELLIDEKKNLLDFAMQEDAFVFYTHDPKVAMSKITRNEKGQYVAVICD